MLVSDDGLQPTPIFTTSWNLTIFGHDIENLSSVQRLYDVFLASHPLMIVYLVVATIMLYKDELYENVDEFQSSVCFFVFKAPLVKLNQPDQVEKVIEMANEIRDQVPISMILEIAEDELNIKLTDRECSPFRQKHNG